MPTEFTRLRYAYGLRLGAVELSDEQGYLVGKHRFHNAHCHGAGVLCGLKAERFVWPQGSPDSTPSTVLRVSQGAALDQCGREVLVPCDQCIDVAAWFGQRITKLGLPTGATTLALRVALRYRECPSDPAPVPRDPCGCDSTGCDYSRVREGFELALFAAPFPACAGAVFPAVGALLATLGEAANAGSAALDSVVAAACPKVAQDEWICLADFTASLTAAVGTVPTVSDITVPDNRISVRRTLLSTSALQALVLHLANAADPQSLLADGPTLGTPGFTAGGPDSGTLTLPVNLVIDPGQPSPTPLAEGTFLPAYVRVSFFDQTHGKWDASPTTSGTVKYDASAGQITVAWPPGSHLTAGNYRVSLLASDDQPILDQRMRPLTPARFSRSFALAADANGHLAWAPVSL